MNKPEFLAVQFLAELRAKDPDAEQAIAETPIPCILAALFAAVPTFLQALGDCLNKNQAPDGYDPREDSRCQ